MFGSVAVMPCPHSLKSGPCSSCMGVTPRVVTTQGAELLIDGKPTGRTLDRETQVVSDYARRGGRAKARRPAP
jgi:hypothetical protein